MRNTPWKQELAADSPFRALAQSLPIPCWISDAVGKVGWVNDAWIAYTGFELGRIEAEGLAPLHDPVVYPKVRERWAQALATGSAAEMVFPLKGRDGRFRPFQTHVVPIRDAEGQVTGWFGINTDISEQAETSRQLSSREEELQEIFTNAGDAIFLFDRRGRMVRVNEAGCDLLGASEAQLLGTRATDYLRSADVADATQALDVARGAPVRREWRLRRPDGSTVLTEISSRVLSDGRHLALVRDVGEQRRAEEELRQSEARLQRSQAVGRIGSYEWDLASGQGVQSEGMLRMVGLAPPGPYTLREIIGPVLREDYPQVFATVEAVNAGAGRRVTEYRIRRPGETEARWIRDTGEVEVDETGKPVRWVGIIQDVTEEIEAAAEARLARDRLQALNATLEAQVAERTQELDRTWRLSRDILSIWTTEGRLIRASPAWRTILGLDPASAEGRPHTDFKHPDDWAPAERGFQRIARGEVVADYVDRYLHADGSFRWISWSAVSENGLVYAVGRDVTDDRQRQQELEQAQEALRQSQKLESMGQLTGGVAHDFNNLLTPIVGSLDLLQRRGVGGEREQRLIENALQSAERAKVLVQRLLAFARRQPLQAVSVDAKALIENMADLVASTSGPNIRVALDVAEDLPPIKADPTQIEMALLNLSVNARDAMPSGGALTISARTARADARRRQDGLGPGRYVRLAVSDTGVGMDEATLRRAIEPFFSTKGVGKGTGLGLSMAHGLAEQLGGKLYLKSRVGVGTQVELWLPVADEAPASREGEETPEVLAALGTVLLVDDEASVRTSTAEMLADLGFAVVEADSADHALALLDGGLMFDLMVTDHLMPGRDGVELARLVQRQRPAARILVVSGYAEMEGIAPDLSRLTKPFRQSELAGSLQALGVGMTGRLKT